MLYINHVFIILSMEMKNPENKKSRFKNLDFYMGKLFMTTYFQTILLDYLPFLDELFHHNI